MLPRLIKPMSLRRVRGALLRLVRRRGLSFAVGLMLALPSGWIEFSGSEFPAWAQGIALVTGAVGLALVWTGIAGLGPDWVDPD